MSFNVKISAKAIADIEALFAWLVEKSDEDHALRFLDGMENIAERIGDNPLMYPKSGFSRGAGEKNAYRGAIFGNYKVFYTVDEEREIVEVQRVVHMASDYTRWMI